MAVKRRPTVHAQYIYMAALSVKQNCTNGTIISNCMYLRLVLYIFFIIKKICFCLVHILVICLREEPLESQLTELECVTSCPVSTSDGTLFSPHTPQSTPSPATPVTSPPPELSTMPCASLTLSELSQVMLSWTESPSNFVVSYTSFITV